MRAFFVLKINCYLAWLKARSTSEGENKERGHSCHPPMNNERTAFQIPLSPHIGHADRNVRSPYITLPDTPDQFKTNPAGDLAIEVTLSNEPQACVSTPPLVLP
jgi:hypothetical protein